MIHDMARDIKALGQLLCSSQVPFMKYHMHWIDTRVSGLTLNTLWIYSGQTPESGITPDADKGHSEISPWHFLHTYDCTTTMYRNYTFGPNTTIITIFPIIIDRNNIITSDIQVSPNNNISCICSLILPMLFHNYWPFGSPDDTGSRVMIQLLQCNNFINVLLYWMTILHSNKKIL